MSIENLYKFIYLISNHFSVSFRLSYSNENNFEFPTLDEIFILRKNRGVYKWFCDTILPEVIGSREFAKLCEFEPLSNFITISDEAFVLVCMENYYEKLQNKVQKEFVSDESNLEEIIVPNPTPLYTKPGASPHKRSFKGSFKYSGWTV